MNSNTNHFGLSSWFLNSNREMSTYYYFSLKTEVQRKNVISIPKDNWYTVSKYLLKANKFQNENRKSSHCPKYERKIWKILPWILWAEFFKFIFSFWNLLTFKRVVCTENSRLLISAENIVFMFGWNLHCTFLVCAQSSKTW